MPVRFARVHTPKLHLKGGGGDGEGGGGDGEGAGGIGLEKQITVQFSENKQTARDGDSHCLALKVQKKKKFRFVSILKLKGLASLYSRSCCLPLV